MGTYIQAAVEAFLTENEILAQRNRLGLMDDGEWESPEAVPVDQIRKRFSGYEDLVQDEKILNIPLHERNSAELTDEFIQYRGSGLMPCFVYYDTGNDQRRRIGIDKFSDTTLAWQLRFWSSQYEPPTSPSYASESHSQTTATDGENPTDLDVSHIETVVEPSVAYTDTKASKFFEHLREFVDQQRDRDREERRDAFNRLSGRSYVHQYGGMYDALPIRHIEGSNQPDLFKISASEELQNRNNLDIRHTCELFKDSEVIIGLHRKSNIDLPNTHASSLPVVGTIVGIDKSAVTIALSPDQNTGAAKEALRYLFEKDSTLLKVGAFHNPVPYERELNAIRQVENNATKREPIVGNGPILFDSPHSATGSFPALNEFQTEAAARAVVANDVALIHGPPGTGKTRTLVALLKHFVRNGKRVLACAHSNQATDNMLVGTSSPGRPDPDSLHAAALAENTQLRISRTGSHTNNPVVAKNYSDVPAGSANVVGATMSAASQFDPDTFDVAIVDEASQASIPATMIPYIAAERIILAGDHKQLPPYGSNELEESEMEISLFEHFVERYGDNIATLLRRQYRMHEQIASFSSTQFYDGDLETDEQNRGWTIGKLPPLEAIQVKGEEKRAQGRSYSNKQEAELVTEEVESLLQNGVESSDIGVITAYRGQISTIRSHLGGIEGNGAGVKVDTVDSFQGGEREAIIVSFVRSNEDGRAGFLTLPDEGKRRLNVALTRARKRLVLVGDFETLKSPENRPDCTEVYQELVDYLEDTDSLREVEAISEVAD